LQEPLSDHLARINDRVVENNFGIFILWLARLVREVGKALQYCREKTILATLNAISGD
jgi:hypothetical protein